MNFEKQETRSGNFDLLRLIAAGTVIWSHEYALLGYPEPQVPIFGSAGGLAVAAFFAISGYLNGQSILRSGSALRFLWARLLRIYPALMFCALFCAGCGALLTSVTLSDFLCGGGQGLMSKEAPLPFILKNSSVLFGLQYGLAGVFEGNVHRWVNGSLWTIPYEVKLYLYLSALFALCAQNKRVLTAVLFVGAIAFVLGGLFSNLTPLWRPHFGVYFAVIFASGVMLAAIEVGFGSKVAFAVFGSLIAAHCIRNQETAALVAVAPICLLAARLPLPSWSQPKIDISYGLYLYAFPIQQSVAMTHLAFWLQFAMAAGLTCLCATCSALLVERPALKLKARRFPKIARMPLDRADKTAPA